MLMHDVMFRQDMRTTLSIDDDVLTAAKSLAEIENRSLGAVISDLARKSLRQPSRRTTRNGIPLLPLRPDAGRVTMESVNALRDDLP